MSPEEETVVDIVNDPEPEEAPTPGRIPEYEPGMPAEDTGYDEEDEDIVEPKAEEPDGDSDETEETPETPEGTVDEPEAEPKAEDETKEAEPPPIKVEDEEVPVADLVEAYKAKKTTEVQLNEANNKLESVSQFYNHLMQNPKDALMAVFQKSLGDSGKAEKTLVEYFEPLVRAKWEEELLPEEQKVARRQEREYERLQRENEELRHYREEAEYQREVQRWRDTVQKQVKDAISLSGLEENEYHTRRAASMLQEQLQAGQQVSLETIANTLQAERQAYLESMLSGMSEEEIKKLRPDLLEAARKRDIEAVEQRRKSPASKPAAGKSPAKTPRRDKKKEFTSMADYRESVGFQF